MKAKVSIPDHAETIESYVKQSEISMSVHPK